jgi:hypothetical protein
LILSVGDLYYNETGGVKNMPEFLLMIVYSLFFGGRGLIFGLVSIGDRVKGKVADTK